MKFYEKKWPWLSLALLICVVIGGYLYVQHLFREMVESKGINTTEATVLRKEHFRCDDAPCVYTSGYGDRVEMKRGETKDRVYYQIINFDNLEEPRRSRAVRAENDRVQKSGDRFTYANDWYGNVGPGTKLYIRFRCFSNGEIQIWGESNEP
jgi:hypothetical protein